MSKIIVISSSVRTGKKSNRVALFLANYINEQKLAEAEIVDLEDYQFPVFNERLSYLDEPPQNLLDFSKKIEDADGIIIVSPEYNGGYPASLKNAIDVLLKQWKRKPVAISTVSAGPFAGMNLITSLQFILWKIGAWTVPAMFPVASVDKSFDEDGKPADEEDVHKRAASFIGELMWCITAKQKMQ